MSENSTKIVISAEDRASAILGAVGGKLEGFGGAAAAANAALASLSAGAALAGLGAMAKAAIDAADSLNDMSQRTGIAVKDLAGYKLAADQSGASLETVAKGVKGLGSAMLEHGDALKKIGIDTKDANVAMRQLAEMFSAMPDGMEKSALATKLFGKAGAELIPLLNLGSSGLEASAVAAERYAIAMDALAPVADAFNDNIAATQINLQAMGAEMANQLAPTLNVIAQAMLDASKEADGLSATGAVLKAVFETVAILGANVAFVFKTTGMEIGAWAAQIAALGRLDFAGFKAISDAVNEDAERARAALDKFERDILNPPQIAAAAKTAPSDDVLERWNKLRDALSSGGKAAKEDGDDFAHLKRMMALLVADEKEVIEALKVIGRENNAAFDSIMESEEAARLATEKSIGSLLVKIEAMERETALMGLSADERERAIMMLALEAEKANLSADAYETLKQRMEAALSASSARRASVEAAEESKKAWERAFDDVGRSLTDAIMDGGQDAGQLLQNYFRTLVLRPIIQGVVNAGMSAIGLGGVAGAANGGINLFGAANSGYGLLSGNVGGGLYGAFATSSVGQSLGLSTAATLSTPEAFLAGAPNMLTPGGLTSFGTALPYLGAALAVGSMLGLFEGDGPAERFSTYNRKLGVDLAATANPDGGPAYEWKNNRWFSGDMAAAQESYSATMIAGEKNLIGALNLTEAQIAAIDTAFAGLADRVYGFGTEGTDWLASMADEQILADRMQAIADTLGIGVDAVVVAMNPLIAGIKDVAADLGYSLQDVATMAQGMGSVDAAVAALSSLKQQIDAIGASAAQSSASFADSIRTVQMDVLDNAGKYDFLDREAQRYRAVLASLTDATLIGQYQDKLNATMMQGWSLLDAEQRKAAEPDMVARLQAANDFVQSRFDAAKDAAKETLREQYETIKQAVVDGMRESAAALVGAANAQAASNDALVDTLARGIVATVNAPVLYSEVGGG